ncbi:MAG TPA: hypothetical protein VML75_14550 [Kofleriaceae bacterium]|nr:hypothetical protein [Kofleriaceae bacterium]
MGSELHAICLDCRTVLGADEPCDVASHHPVSLADGHGREDLAARIWGPLSTRRKVKRAATAGSAGGGGGAVLDGCGGCDAGGIDGQVALILLTIVVAVLVVWLLYKLIRAIAQRRHTLVPNGADRRPGHLGLLSATGVVEVDADATIEAPTSVERCVAWGLELATTRWFRRRPQLRAGASGAFRVRTDDGRVVHLPAGRVVVSMKGARDAPIGPAQAYLAGLGLGGTDGNGYLLLPHDVARERLIRPGDRVEIHGPLEEQVVAGAAHQGGYRDAPPTRLTPRGVPRLRVI